MKTISDLAKDLTPLIYNPNLMQMAVLNSLTDVVNGDSVEIVDPGNPFIFMMDNAVALTACSIEHNESILRQRYPVMATRLTELYPHMSDRDYLDMFSQPAHATWLLILGRDELRDYAVPRDSMGIRKLVIPRDTEFSVAGYTFTTQYAIELKQMPHGGIQIVYDTNEMSPIRTLATNNLNWKVIDIPFNGKPISMVYIEVPVMQYKIDSYNENIIKGTTFYQQYDFNDQFFTARVWLRDVNAKWVEIQTTHAQRVINPDIATAQLTVGEHSLSVSIPDIYIRSGLAQGDVRVDLYTTKGNIEVDLRQYAAENFKFHTRDIGNEVNSMYYTPLNTFTNITAISDTVVAGGRNSLSFEQMKKRLIDNAVTGRKIPVSEKQLESVLSDRGFKLTKSIDYVTERIYMASTEMLKSTIPTVSTPVGNINGILETNQAQLVELARKGSVYNNGNRLTITPNMLYVEENGLVKIADVSVQEFKSQPVADIVSKLNSANYLSSPLHYVIDNNSDILSMRPYYLDNAKIISKQFVETNATLMLDITTDSFSLETTEDGYRILITTRSTDSYQAIPDGHVGAQMSFTPRGYSDSYAYLNGSLLGRTEDNERIFEFKIESNLDIDLNHDLIVNNFIVSGNTSSPTPLRLDCEVNLIFTVNKYTTAEFKHSNIDTVLVTDDKDTKGITHERLNILFGKPLDRIWSNIRSIVDTIEYDRWESDVYATYTSDIIAKTPEGTPQYSISTGADGKPKVSFVYEHRKGDFIISNGEKVLLHAAGSIKMENGKPIIKNPRKVGWRLELFLFDAKYIFSNTPATVSYMDKVTTNLLQYLTVDIPDVDTMLLEKTDLYLYPRSTIGQVNVLKSDGTISAVDAACKFELRYFLSAAGRSNDDLLKTLNRVSRQVILSNLENKTISASAIVKDIRDIIGSEIVDVEMESIGATGERLYTVVDEADKLTLGKKVSVNPDGTISIIDDITIAFNRHDLGA